jgi:hypothetical protein
LPLEEPPCDSARPSFADRKRPMSCEIQSALTKAWFDAIREFSGAVQAMPGDHIRTMSRGEYLGLRAKAEESRLASENARVSLDLHRKEHGC